MKRWVTCIWGILVAFQTTLHAQERQNGGYFDYRFSPSDLSPSLRSRTESQDMKEDQGMANPEAYWLRKWEQKQPKGSIIIDSQSGKPGTLATNAAGERFFVPSDAALQVGNDNRNIYSRQLPPGVIEGMNNPERYKNQIPEKVPQFTVEIPETRTSSGSRRSGASRGTQVQKLIGLAMKLPPEDEVSKPDLFQLEMNARVVTLESQLKQYQECERLLAELAIEIAAATNTDITITAVLQREAKMTVGEKVADRERLLKYLK